MDAESKTLINNTALAPSYNWMPYEFRNWSIDFWTMIMLILSSQDNEAKQSVTQDRPTAL